MLIFFQGFLLLFFSIVAINSLPYQKSQTWLQRGSHDKNCYTQGFSFINSTHILESCGMYNQSYFQILKYDPDIPLLQPDYVSQVFDSTIFLEGSVLFPKNNLIYILTWREKIIYRFNGVTMEYKDQLSWFSQGWGFTHNNTHLFISDGSDTIYVTNENIDILQEIKVRGSTGSLVNSINELQWVQESNGQFIYANLYGSSNIIKISIETGKLVHNFDLSQLIKDTQRYGRLKRDYVLNGIAFDKNNNNFIVTGKRWNDFYVIDMK